MKGSIVPLFHRHRQRPAKTFHLYFHGCGVKAAVVASSPTTTVVDGGRKERGDWCF